ncbi:MAG: AMP-binding protein [Gemmatimonadaceae bacterium]|nr:AMP-binding protein [Gemmatimonadaceae bacterium]
MSLLALYAPSLRGRAHTPALECRTPDGALRTLTFGELDQRSTRLATYLRTRGLSRGDRLAFCLPNRLAVIELWIACTILGVIVVPINVLYKGREIAHIIGDAKPTAVVTTPDRAADVPAGTTLWDVADLERATEGVAGDTAHDTAQFTAEPCDADTPAAIIYTSGTTGTAKGAVLTHGNFAANARALISAWGITHTDRYLAALPLFHVHGLGNGIQCWLASGCHMRLEERFDREDALDWFDTYRPTLFFGVPTIYVRLLEAPAERARSIGAHMRLFVSGSAPLPAQTLEAFRERFGHVILERYGMTETLMNVSNPLEGERRPGSVGLPLATTEVEVRDAEGAVVPDGEVGELWVRGPNVCHGYWQRPDATAAAFIDGWFRTGDIGVRAADGYITLQGRRSDLIISGGFNIYPREIEELLLTLPGVREAAVTGESDPVRGEVPVAYVVGDDSLDLDALAAQVRAELASFKLPRRWVRLNTLPRTALGKVQKHLLAAQTT